VLKERLRPVQWAAVATAAAGVAWLTWAQGTPPWIALILAASFSTYGLLRKTATLGALEGSDAGDAAARPAGARRAWLGDRTRTIGLPGCDTWTCNCC